MNRITLVMGLLGIAGCSITYPAQAQTSPLQVARHSPLSAVPKNSATAQVRQKVDSLQRLTQPGYYKALLAVTKRPAGSVMARLAAETCTSYLCGTIEVVSVKDGSWNDPTTWSVNRVPNSADQVRLRHVVSLPASYNAQAQLLRYDTGGKLQPGAGSRLQMGL
jgi:hypothetical protein